jgi:hypothetical protein
VKDKLKERIDKLGIAIENSGDRLEKIGAFLEI